MASSLALFSSKLSVCGSAALYIHFPWCLKKCPYCDFNSHTLRGALPEEEYIAALIRDLEWALPSVWGRSFFSIFLGGGTPSLFSPQSIDFLLSQVRARLSLQPDLEVTLEANPGTLFPQHVASFFDAGITRISLGAQSFSPDFLQKIGRIHGVREIEESLAAIARTPLNVNIDLMYGLPGQSVEAAQKDLSCALSFSPDHLSLYHLSLEPGTLFAARPPKSMPSSDCCADMSDCLCAYLADQGYDRYEVSAFSREGKQCVHNLNYWQYGDYLGIGAGAHSKWSTPQEIRRQVRVSSPMAFMAKAGSVSSLSHDALVSAEERPFEFFLNALRLVKGCSWALYEERTGLSRITVFPIVHRLVDQGLLECDLSGVRATGRGFDFLNEITASFLTSSMMERQ